MGFPEFTSFVNLAFAKKLHNLTPMFTGDCSTAELLRNLRTCECAHIQYSFLKDVPVYTIKNKVFVNKQAGHKQGIGMTMLKICPRIHKHQTKGMLLLW